MASLLAADAAPRRSVLRPDALLHSIALLVGMNVVQRGLGFGRAVLLCRWLAPGEIGDWDLTLGFFELAAPLAILSIPSVYARYVEYYRQRGHLRTFLARTTLACVALTVVSLAAMIGWRDDLARWLFGGAGALRLVYLVIVALPPVIAFNALQQLLNALRLFRLLAVLQLAQSVLFAGLALGLAARWHAGADSVILAYGGSCAACSLLPAWWMFRVWHDLPEENAPLGEPFWRRLAAFIVAVCLSNTLVSVFLMSDRFLILHLSRMSVAEASAALGQYHSARLVPLLIVQLAALVSTMFVPYLSCDWEAGRRPMVVRHLNLFLKVLGLGLTTGCAVLLWAAPLLFVKVLAGKFAEGQSLLPWTLLCAVWFSLFTAAKVYFWCDERVQWVNVALGAGLAVGVAANLVLLPTWGLRGAMVAAALSHFALLVVAYGLARYRGMPIARGTWIVSALPVALCLGGAAAAVITTGALALSAATPWIFDEREKALLAAFGRRSESAWRMLHAGGEDPAPPPALTESSPGGTP